MRGLKTSVAVWLFPICAWAQSAPPALDLLLTPHLANGKVSDVGVTLKLEKPNVAAGDTLLRMPTLIVSIPTARYDGEALQARDEAGPLPLTQKDEAPTPTGNYRQWIASRATVGDVTVTAKAPPRVVDATTRTGPLFDLREENGGLLGAGITFLPLPNTKTPYRLHVHWDLSAYGNDKTARGVWSLGEGDVDTVGPAEQLAFSFYAAGPLKRFPDEDAGNFHMYWLTDPPFQPAEVAARIKVLYAYMSNFFHDANAPYRVFIRHNPHKGGGGTALAKSFMFGWNEATAPTLDNLQDLLAHEMTHNWPKLDGGEHGDTAWYSEGTAEYYSLLLSLRAGVITLDQFLDRINERAEQFQTNPYRNASNKEAAKHFWSDWSAQRVPYGRGFLYLAQTDAKIRAASKGKRSLDDVVLAIRARQQNKQQAGIDTWIELVTKEIGPQAKADFDAMVAGKPIVPTGSFAPCFKIVPARGRPFQMGFDAASLIGEKRTIKGVVPGSAAANAGLRDGDAVLEAIDPVNLYREKNGVMSLKVRHADGSEQSIHYVPREAETATWKWVRDAKVPEKACRF